ncbi:UNVERIFIED_CONTAM: hypothetical protein K2H54_054466 [Gekko kuhli]
MATIVAPTATRRNLSQQAPVTTWSPDTNNDKMAVPKSWYYQGAAEEPTELLACNNTHFFYQNVPHKLPCAYRNDNLYPSHRVELDLIQTISAVDKDSPMEHHQFSFNLAEDTSNRSSFAVKDNQNNTAGILTKRNGFYRQEQPVFALPILIADNGIPPLVSTSTLTVLVCDCDTEVNPKYCRYGALGISVEAFVAVVACTLIILVFVLAVLAFRQQKKKSLFHEKGEDFRENIVKYDDEGGGEQDTEAFDIPTLRNHSVLREHKPRRNVTTQIQSLYRQSLQVGPESAIFREFISQKLEEANSDPDVPPYDTLQTYVFEGAGSVAGSLSSLGSSSLDLDTNYDDFVQLGFRQEESIHGSVNTGWN